MTLSIVLSAAPILLSIVSTSLVVTVIVVLVVVVPVQVDGHALLTVPSSKNGGNIQTPLESSTKHYAIASYGIIDKAFFDNDHSITPWKRPGEFDHVLARDLIPGHPETLHPCGCNAGGVPFCAGIQASGFGETTIGTTVTPPSWAKGSTQETAWNAWVNHGGGHIYMLCKKSAFDLCRETFLPSNPLQASKDQNDAYLKCVWDCFESNTLEWDTDANVGTSTWSQKLQFQDDHCTYATMDPMTKVGKDDHIWRFTPIPDSLQVTNGGEGKCMWDSLISFSNDRAREKFMASFGTENVCDWGLDSHAPSDWHVFDKVKVPTDIEEGEYLLSWRWDAYKADQMWTNCADINITAPSADNDHTNTAAGELTERDGVDGCLSTSSPTKSPMELPPASPVSPAPSPTPVASPPTSPTEPNCPPQYTGMKPYDNCTKYYHCQNGEVAGNILECPNDTLFDVDMQYCNWAYLVNCATPPKIGCYSNNFKDCNHPDFQYEDASCHTIWMPEGSRNSCIPLWGSCTNQKNGSNCCEPAICYQGTEGSSYSQCIVPPTPAPVTLAPVVSPSTPAPVACKNRTDKWRLEKGGVKQNWCDWAKSKNPTNRCKVRDLYNDCPKTCTSSCSSSPVASTTSAPVASPTDPIDCNDRTEKWRIVNSSVKQNWCTWAKSKKTTNRCKVKDLYEDCPKTCGSCPS